MIVFNNAKLVTGGDWDGRWESECGTYSIMRFEYRSERGLPARPVPTYYKAYKNSMSYLEGGSLNDVVNRVNELEQGV